MPPALEIRLQRVTTRKLPCFRVVVVAAGDKSGRFLEQVGLFDPVKKQEGCEINTTRLQYWLSMGATPVGDAAAMIAQLDLSEG